MRSNRRYRSRWLHRLLKRPPNLLVGQVNARATQNKGRRSLLKGIQKWLQHWNTIKAPLANLDARMHRELGQTFHGEIMKLSDLLARDLSHWEDG